MQSWNLSVLSPIKNVDMFVARVNFNLIPIFFVILVFPQALILGLYEDPMQPAEAATVTETLGDYLKGVGY